MVGGFGLERGEQLVKPINQPTATNRHQPPQVTKGKGGEKVSVGCGGGAGAEEEQLDPTLSPAGDGLLLMAEPEGRANSFVGTEEYLAPEVRARSGDLVIWARDPGVIRVYTICHPSATAVKECGNHTQNSPPPGHQRRGPRRPRRLVVLRHPAVRAALRGHALQVGLWMIIECNLAGCCDTGCLQLVHLYSAVSYKKLFQDHPIDPRNPTA
jgi:hypothetical protein